MTKKLFLYHIIYIAFISVSFGQNLNLKIIGANEVETKIIDSIPYLKKHANYISIESETDSIFSSLVNKGYLEAKIKSISKLNDSSFISEIVIGEIYKSLTIYYQDSIISQSFLKKITNKYNDSSFTISIPESKTKLKQLTSLIAQNGFPFTSLQLSKFSIDENKNVTAVLNVNKNGKERVIDNVIIKGYEKFPKSYLKHFLKIKRNELFNLKTIKAKTQLLDNLRFSNQIKEPEVLFTNDSTTLYLYLEKAKSNNFDGFLGFGTNEETRKIEFDGYLNLELNNNLNYGETFKLLYKSDEIDQKTFNANLNLPYLFNSPIGIELGLNIFKKDTLFTTTNQLAKAFYQINAKNLVKIGIENIESNNLVSENLIGVDDYKTTLYQIGYQFLKQDNSSILFRNQSGINTEIGFGKRTLSNTSEKQTGFKFEIYKNFNLNPENKIYLRFNTNGLISDTYLENELIRFGGINSIRGFEENSLTATLLGVVNTEYRYLLSSSIYVHSIFDFSYLENQITNQKEKLFGFGFGFGILTQAGVFRLIYANGKSENQVFQISNSKVHLSLSAFF